MVVPLRESPSGERLAQRLGERIRRVEVLQAIRRVAREDFLAGATPTFADEEQALPIGYAQTTSNPIVIARMLEMLLKGVSPPQTVLEIGAGCGYQTALLAEMGCNVIGLERIRPLAEEAARRLRRFGYDTARILHRDGFSGYVDKAPYDGIIVCAECADIPAALPAQLTAGGRLILPLREKANGSVRLTAVSADGKILSRQEHVSFVPMRAGIE